MFFTTVVRAATAARFAVRPATRIAPRRLAAAAAPRTAFLAPRVASWTAVRNYSAAGGLAREEVFDRIKQLLSTFDKVNDPQNITEKAHFANDLGLDSLDTVEVVMAIEEEFSIEIPDKDADTIHSIDKAVEYIVGQPDAN